MPEPNLTDEAKEVLKEALDEVVSGMVKAEYEKDGYHDETDHAADLRTELEDDGTISL